MNATPDELQVLASKLTAIAASCKSSIERDGTSALERQWGIAMTAAWQAVPHAIRLALVDRGDVLNPDDTDRRLEEAVRLLARQSLTSTNFVRETSTGDVYLDLGSSYLESEFLQIRLLRLHAHAGCNSTDTAPAASVRSFVLSEFKSKFVPHRVE